MRLQWYIFYTFHKHLDFSFRACYLHQFLLIYPVVWKFERVPSVLHISSSLVSRRYKLGKF